MTEIWLPVVGYEDFYEVSDHGRVRSLDRIVNTRGRGTYLKPGRILKHQKNTTGRHQVTLCVDAEQIQHQVHRLVLAAFVGPCPDNLVALHWDDDCGNNQLSNLRYGTLSANQYDRVRNGLHYKANQTHCIHGHEFTPENTYPSRGTGRQCKPCTRRRERERQERLRIA